MELHREHKTMMDSDLPWAALHAMHGFTMAIHREIIASLAKFGYVRKGNWHLPKLFLVISCTFVRSNLS
jgi:hypothetical protein